MGGQGKTALVGRWLKHERAPELADMPVFYWSFYEDLDVGKFLQQVVEFCLPLIYFSRPAQIEPLSFLLRVVQELRLLLVLDGLEVVQEDANGSVHGHIRDPNLQQFLQQWLRYPHQALMILTSRFPFPQLARYTGVGFHHRDLLRLSQEDGVSLLQQLGLRGSPEIFAQQVEKFQGHPLALRVLASAVKRACHGDLDQFTGEQLLESDAEDGLSQKLERLLGFYESRLQDGQRELLGIISLFKRPVEQKSFVTLLSKMESLESTPLAQADETGIQKQLNILTADFLVEQTREGITTHPIIRDYFRTRHALDGSRREVADFLTERPGTERPQNIEEVRDLVEAVQLLCDEGELKAANDLQTSRLRAGGYAFDVFRSLPAPTEGLECDLAFVGDETRQKKIAEELGKGHIAAHMSGAAVYHFLLGNLAQSKEWRYKTLEIRRQLQDQQQQALELDAISLIEITMGDIKQALETVSQALSLSHETRNLDDLHTTFAYKAYYEFVLGNTPQAYQYFEVALFYIQKRKADEQFLSSGAGNQQSEFFIRLKAWQQFEAVSAWNIKNCEKYHWNRDLAVCHLLQGWSEVSRKRFAQAEEELNQAERILRPSGLVEYICRLDWGWALLAEAKGEYRSGLQRVQESLFTCADKGFRLWQADHLTLRGRLYLLQFQKEGK